MSRNDQQSPEEQLRLLANRVCDGTVSAEERDQLEELLRTDPDLRSLYLSYMQLNAALIWRYRTGEEHTEKPVEVGSHDLDPDPSEELSAEMVTLPERSERRLPATSRRHESPASTLVLQLARYGTILAAAAATVLVVWMLAEPTARDVDIDQPLAAVGESGNLGTESPDEALVATLRDATGVLWHEAGSAIDVGARIPTGELNLAEGQAELVFDSGAKLFLAAPVQLRVDSPRVAFLAAGKVTAHMPETAIARITYLSAVNTASTLVAAQLDPNDPNAAKAAGPTLFTLADAIYARARAVENGLLSGEDQPEDVDEDGNPF